MTSNNFMHPSINTTADITIAITTTTPTTTTTTTTAAATITSFIATYHMIRSTAPQQPSVRFPSCPFDARTRLFPHITSINTRESAPTSTWAPTPNFLISPAAAIT
jgi:hypothetical protein